MHLFTHEIEFKLSRHDTMKFSNTRPKCRFHESLLVSKDEKDDLIIDEEWSKHDEENVRMKHFNLLVIYLYCMT